jgi:hypothetical protein
MVDQAPYQTLPSQRHIRVLLLHPAKSSDAPLESSLENRLLPVQAKVHLDYEALSYVWGSPEGDRPLQCNGETVMITENCEDALRHLRDAKITRTLWIDAICVNQKSIPERNQ